MIDYRELLKKYIHLVIEQEGIAYLSDLNADYSDVRFTEQEEEEIYAIAMRERQ